MDLKKLKSRVTFIKLMIFVVFAVAIFFAVTSKPKLSPELAANLTEVVFKSFGGERADWAWTLLEDNGYVAVGDTASYGAGLTDVYLIKTDYDGSLLWTRTFGGAGKDNGIAVIKGHKQGYVIAGGTGTDTAGEMDAYIVRTDSDGEKVWEKTFGGENYDFAYSVAKTRDGNYVAAGYSSSFNTEKNSDIYIFKFDDKGNKIWDTVYGGAGWDTAYSIIETKDGGLIYTGYIDKQKEGETDIILMKTDAEGNCRWARTYGGVRKDVGTNVIETKDGGYLITGKSTSYIGRGMGWDIIALKTDAKGNSQWAAFLPAAESDVGYNAVEEKGGYTIAGTKRCYGICDANVYIAKIDLKGNTLSYKIYAGSKDDNCSSIIKDSKGDYVLAGTTSSAGNLSGDIFLMKVDPQGVKTW
ncbi:MAG: hypothetical protein CVV21_02850 [Candidatus Goldiibacteriota bacterium HGW-Goldbacteria-1]|jgi:hypothetical protein|nr:MAG: hypothetical protein CVV21_02850 [Candidatus Goldiibacteriota bacterium HGW-Goldbacteria-1]